MAGNTEPASAGVARGKQPRDGLPPAGERGDRTHGRSPQTKGVGSTAVFAATKERYWTPLNNRLGRKGTPVAGKDEPAKRQEPSNEHFTGPNQNID